MTHSVSIRFVVLAASIAFIVFVYIARMRASEVFFDKSNEPSVKFQFTDDILRMQSELGSTDLKRTVFEEVLKFPKAWLLVYAKSGYITLPIDQLTRDDLQSIETHISKKS